METNAPSPCPPGEPRPRQPPALTRPCDFHPLGVKLYTNPTGVLSQSCGRGGKPVSMQVEKENARLELGARKNARGQTRPEHRTIRELCFDQELRVKKAFASMPPGPHARMELRKPVVHARLTPGSTLHQCLVKVGINVKKCALRRVSVGASGPTRVAIAHPPREGLRSP